jgi:hypothetical protein
MMSSGLIGEPSPLTSAEFLALHRLAAEQRQPGALRAELRRSIEYLGAEAGAGGEINCGAHR